MENNLGMFLIIFLKVAVIFTVSNMLKRALFTQGVVSSPCVSVSLPHTLMTFMQQMGTNILFYNVWIIMNM